MSAKLVLYHQSLEGCFANVKAVLPAVELPQKSDIQADRQFRGQRYYPTFRAVFQSKSARAISEILPLIQKLVENDWMDPAAIIEDQNKPVACLLLGRICKANPSRLQSLSALQVKSISAIFSCCSDVVGPESILGGAEFMFQTWAACKNQLLSQGVLSALGHTASRIFMTFKENNIFPEDLEADGQLLNTSQSIAKVYAKLRLINVVDLLQMHSCLGTSLNIIDHFQTTGVTAPIYSIKNEIQELNDKFGWCFICRKPAPHYCSIARMPVCGVACKKKLAKLQLLMKKACEEIKPVDESNAVTIWNFLIYETSGQYRKDNSAGAAVLLDVVLQVCSQFSALLQAFPYFQIPYVEMVRLAHSEVHDVSKSAIGVIANLLSESTLPQNQLLFLTFNELLESDNSLFSMKRQVIRSVQTIARRGKVLVRGWANFSGATGLSGLAQTLIKISTGKYSDVVYTNNVSKEESQEAAILALEAVGHIFKAILKWVEDVPKDQDEPLPKELLLRSHRVEIENVFNKKAVKGFKMLNQVYKSIYGREMGADEVARIVFEWKFEKDMKGEFFGQDNQFCSRVLASFLNQYLVVEEIDIAEAVRQCFRLISPPKESQQITRIIEELGNFYVSKHPESEIKTGDSAYFLMVALFQLQTILYNPKVEDKMTLAQFHKNVGNDFSLQLLSTLYKSVQNQSLGYIESGLAKKRAQDALVKTEKIRKMNFQRETKATLRRLNFRLGKLQKDQVVFNPGLSVARCFIKDLWHDLFFFFIQPLAENSNEEQTQKVFLIVEQLLRICFVCRLGEESRLLVQFLVKMTGVVQQLLYKEGSFQSTSSVLEAGPRTKMKFSKELAVKNFIGIDCILRVAVENGNAVGQDWLKVLQLISCIDQCFLAEPKPQRKEVEKVNRQRVAGLVNRVSLDRVFSSTIYLEEATLIDFIRALASLSEEELNQATTSSSRLFSLQHIVEVVEYNLDRPGLDWERIWQILRKYFSRAGCHPNSQVGLYVIDCLKQLAIKSLKNGSVSGVLQLIFAPFLDIFEFSLKNKETKQLIIGCLQMVLVAAHVDLEKAFPIVLRLAALGAKDAQPVQLRSLQLVQKILFLQNQSARLHFGELFQILACVVGNQQLGLRALSSLNRVLKIGEGGDEFGLLSSKLLQVYQQCFARREQQYYPELVAKMFQAIGLMPLDQRLAEFLLTRVEALCRQAPSEFLRVTLINFNRRINSALLPGIKTHLRLFIELYETQILTRPAQTTVALQALREVFGAVSQGLAGAEFIELVQMVVRLVKNTQCAELVKLKDADPDFKEDLLQVVGRASKDLVELSIDKSDIQALVLAHLTLLQMLDELVARLQEWDHRVVKQAILACEDSLRISRCFDEAIVLRLFLWKNSLLAGKQNAPSLLKHEAVAIKILSTLLPKSYLLRFTSETVARYIDSNRLAEQLRQKNHLGEQREVLKTCDMLETGLVHLVDRLEKDEVRPDDPETLLEGLRYCGKTTATRICGLLTHCLI